MPFIEDPLMLLAEACLVAGHYDTATPIEDIDARTFPTVALDASPPLSANTFGLSERIRFTFRRQDFIQNPLAPEHAQKVPVWFKCTVSLTRCQYRSEFASAIYALVWMLLLESYDRAKPSKEHRMFWKVYTGELFYPTMWKGSAGKRTEEPSPTQRERRTPCPFRASTASTRWRTSVATRSSTTRICPFWTRGAMLRTRRISGWTTPIHWRRRARPFRHARRKTSARHNPLSVPPKK